jgi:hypothetical protein
MANHLAFDVLNRLVERQVSTVEETRARRHLAACARCRSELEWLDRIRSHPAVRQDTVWQVQRNH